MRFTIKQLLSWMLVLAMVLTLVPATPLFVGAEEPLPTATVMKINNPDLTFAMNFKADTISDAQLAFYGGWFADFELTVNKEVTFYTDEGADGYLSGQYDDWSENWVNVPFNEAVTLQANETIKIMAFAAELMGEPGLKYTYGEVYSVVKDFDCGVFFKPEFLAANPDLEVKLELKMYNPTNESESYVIGETYIFRNEYVAYNTATQVLYTAVSDATIEAQGGETVIVLRDTTDNVIPVLENTTLDLNGHVLTAGYVSCFGDLADNSESNAGRLQVSERRIMLRNDNAQLPLRTASGYAFVEVLGFNERVLNNGTKYVFQPLLEPYAHALLLEGQATTGATINVRVTWEETNGVRSQDFVYSDEYTARVINSYAPATGKYGKMYTLVLNNIESFQNLKYEAILKSIIGVEIGVDSLAEDEPTGNVTVDKDNKVAEEVTLTNAYASAVVGKGTLLEPGTTDLSLSITEMDDTASNVTAENGQQRTSMDVHINGIAANNTVPVLVTLNEVAPEALNQGNIDLYHVENGNAVKMTRVFSADEVDAHNEYYYDIATGTVMMALATFSEVAVVSDEENAWNGEYDYSWYFAKDADYIIANADQLAAFGAIVGGMVEDINQDSFADKTVKLIADINLGDAEGNRGKAIFHPIGYYYNATENNGKPYSTVYSFEGTFDGNGHTIANFYQNTWEIKGDNPHYDVSQVQYYNDGMGLFGYVLNGTVKNLTVDNFSSDGEFTPTGVIAAYAVDSTFENIAITNCNPRVYNTGNGGIVGIGGNSDDTADKKLTFQNITIDNTNKISALWGSWDVACGGLVGMFRGDGHVYMTNCHVAAQIDVYNDVCGNYQYYWYRYSGMMVGTNKNMTTDANGYTVPETDKFHAENCTVHFGEWNDYYYCELVANSLASYTHDHQFSRLEEIDSLDDIKRGDTWTKAGNFLLIDGDTKTCYHIVNKNGTLTQHLHTEAGEETVNGETVLKEDKQIVFLPFNQLFTGYGWGVKHIPIYDDGTPNPFGGVTILDRTVADSKVKFEKADTAKDSYTTGTTVTIGELFAAAAIDDKKLPILVPSVSVFVSPVGENSTAGATYAATTTDWTQGTLTFSGSGAATITITDYYYCTPTTINVTITEKDAEEKFEKVFKHTDTFLYRVGNANAVSLDRLFEAVDGATINDSDVSVSIEKVDANMEVGGRFTANTSDWTKGSIEFNGTGVVKVTIKDNDTYCTPTELYLEVVDAVNATSAASATANNVVLLNDISSDFTVSGNHTFYGNGFTLRYTGNGQYLNNGLKQGVVYVKDKGVLDNLRIEASIYPYAYMYYGKTSMGEYVQDGPSSVEGDKTRYHYQLSAIAASGNATISNCYIYGGRTNIFVDTGDVTVKNTVLENGTLANMQIQSTESHTVTLEDVTTIQQRVNATIGDPTQVMLGAGVVVGPDGDTNPKIVLNGSFKQYNWVNADDKEAVTNETAKMILGGALDATAYNHTVNGKTASNLGIVYMNENDISVENNTGLPYVESNVSMNAVNGQAYSLQNANASQIYSDIENADRTTKQGDYLPTFNFNLGDQEISYDGSEDTRYLYGDVNGVTALYQDGDAALTLDLSKTASVYKYTGIDYSPIAVCKDSSGQILSAANNVVTLSAQGNYTLEFTVTDNIFYDKNGEKIVKSVLRTFIVPLELTVKEASIKNAEVNITKTALDGVYTTVNLTDYKLRINFLDCISITDYDKKGTGTTVNLSSNIASAALTPSGVNVFTTASTITITYKDGRVLTVNLSKISGSSPGTKTAAINTSGGVYFTTDGALNNKPTEESSQNKCTITSVSFKGNSGSTVTNDTDVTVTWALGSSSGSSPCVTPDTLVTLVDGTQKEIQHVTYEDQLLVWNFYTGEYDVAPASIVMNHGYNNYTVVTLDFDDGTTVNTINGHGFFDVTANKYVILSESNAADYLGHEFVKVDGNHYTTVKLANYSIKTEYTESWSILTAAHYNCILENLWTITPAEVEGSPDYLMPFEIGEGMKYDAEAMQADIEKYGLYTYEDFATHCTYEAFVGFGLDIFKVSVGKGAITWEEILYLLSIHAG